MISRIVSAGVDAINVDKSRETGQPKKIQKLSKKKLEIVKETDIKLPEHVITLQEEVGGFSIPANNEIVHKKFKNLIRKKCVELEDGSLYEGQWSEDGSRYLIN